MTTIIVTHENNETDEFVFDASKLVITLGRRSTNDVCIPDLSISGNHATLTLSDGETILEDLNSTNGSYVNGQVIQRTAITSSDEIILGKILVKFAIDSAGDNAASSKVVDSASATSSVHSSHDPIHASGKEDAASPRTDASTPDSNTNNVSDSGEPSEQDLPDLSNLTTQSATPVKIASLDGDTPTQILPGSASGKPKAANGQSNAESDSAAHPLDGIEHLVVPSEKPTVTPMHELDSPSGNSKGAVIEIKNGAKSGQILPIDKPVTTLGRPGIQIAAIMRKPDGYFLMHIESDDSVDRPTLNSDSVGDEPVLLHSGDELTVAGIDVEFMLS
ncbi:MAG: FHA domain-containing protein [Granulosicoccus sp.]